MIREFKSEDEALALAQTLGLFITKKNGVFIVGNNELEICDKYNMYFNWRDGIFFDAEVFDFILHIRDKSIIDARGMELPYGIKSCSGMFLGCSKLKHPPVIPKSVVSCHKMFEGCKSLEYPPVIPEGVQNCTYMLKGCTRLKYSPVIPEGAKCFEMFRKCLSLKQKPVFPLNANTTDALKETFYDSRVKIIIVVLLVTVIGLFSLFFYIPFIKWCVIAILCFILLYFTVLLIFD